MLHDFSWWFKHFASHQCWSVFKFCVFAVFSTLHATPWKTQLARRGGGTQKIRIRQSNELWVELTNSGSPTKILMSPKVWCHQNFGDIKLLVTSKFWWHRNFDVTKISMSPKFWCHQNFDVTKISMSPKFWCHQNLKLPSLPHLLRLLQIWLFLLCFKRFFGDHFTAKNHT